MTFRHLVLAFPIIVTSACGSEPRTERACTPPKSYWQKPHNFLGLVPLMNHVSISEQGTLHWNGERVSSGTLTGLLRQSHELHPEPVVFLETEMGVPCETVDAVRKQIDDTLECKDTGRCAEGIETVWRQLPSPPYQPIS